MTKEFELAEMLRNDEELMAILTGGVYTDEELGIEGFRRGEGDPTDNEYSPASPAYDEDGYIKPCFLVRSLGEIPFPRTQDVGGNFTAVSQTIQIYMYQEDAHDQIELARDRAWILLNGKRVGRSYPIWCDAETAYMYTLGPTPKSQTRRQDWRVVYTKQG